MKAFLPFYLFILALPLNLEAASGSAAMASFTAAFNNVNADVANLHNEINGSPSCITGVAAFFNVASGTLNLGISSLQGRLTDLQNTVNAANGDATKLTAALSQFDAQVGAAMNPQDSKSPSAIARGLLTAGHCQAGLATEAKLEADGKVLRSYLAALAGVSNANPPAAGGAGASVSQAQ